MTVLKIFSTFFSAWFVVIILLGTTEWLVASIKKTLHEKSKIKIVEEGVFGQLADLLVNPVMYLIAGTVRESAQRTHLWNNRKLSKEEAESLTTNLMVHCKGIPGETAIWPIFHIPIFGGWRRYVVLAPVDERTGDWFVGWKWSSGTDILQISIRDAVRMLEGPRDVSFFGVGKNGVQIKIKKIGAGQIGDGGEWSYIPLH
jgi:hypothetical protein